MTKRQKRSKLGGNAEMPDEFWVRVELELKGDRAKVAGRMIIEHLEKWQVLAAGWIRDFVDFKVPEVEDADSLFVLAATVGHDELFEIVGEASARLSERQVDMIEEYRQMLEEIET